MRRPYPRLAWGGAILTVALVAWGCSPREGERPAAPAATGDAATADTVAADTTAPDSTAAISDSPAPAPATPTMRPVLPGAPVTTPPDGKDRPVPLPGPKPGASLPQVTVAAVLDQDSLVGRRVRVGGDCLRQGAGLVEGSPPVSRSDWELGHEGRAVWVAGQRPVGCTIIQPREAVTIEALVAVDTLKRLDRTTRVRHYLVVPRSP